MPKSQSEQSRIVKKSAILNRITSLLTEKGKQHKDLIEYLKLPIGTYGNWVRGRGFSYVLYIDEIAEYLDVSVYYLLTGEDPYEHLLRKEFRADEAELLRKYNLLTVNSQKAVIEIIDTLRRTVN